MHYRLYQSSKILLSYIPMNKEDLLLIENFFALQCIDFHAASFQFSFGPVSRTGDEATDGSTTMDVAIPVVANIFNPPNNLLTSDTVIILSVTGGSATSRSKIIVVRSLLYTCLVLLLFSFTCSGSGL